MSFTEIKGRLIVDYSDNARLEVGEKVYSLQDEVIINNLSISMSGMSGGPSNYDLRVSLICEVDGQVIKNVALMVVRESVCDYFIRGVPAW